MRRPQGQIIITDPYAVFECDTFTCCHCNSIVPVPAAPAPMVGGFCMRCMLNCCDTCSDLGCTPFEKKLEKMEARERSLRSMGF